MKRYGIYAAILIGCLLLMPTQSAKSQTNTEGFLVSTLSGKCIDSMGSPGVANGALLQLWACESSGKDPNNSTTDQVWRLTSQGFIQNVLSGKCIDVYGAPGTANGAPLQLWNCESSGQGPNNTITDQRWSVRSDGLIQNVLSGKCIDVNGAPGTSNGARLQLWNCEFSGRGPGNSSTDQRWKIQPFNPTAAIGATVLPEFLAIQSNPPGAVVEVGIKSVNGIVRSGTGRKVGFTPIKVTVLPSDVSVTNGYASITVELSKSGYIPHMQVQGLGNYTGSYWTQPGWTVTIQSTLRRP